jgi:hypothetical protein
MKQYAFTRQTKAWKEREREKKVGNNKQIDGLIELNIFFFSDTKIIINHKN